MPTQQQVDLMRERITDEIFMAMGASPDGFWRRALGWLFRLPTGRFAQLFAAADEAVPQGGLSESCRVVVKGLNVRARVRCAEYLQGEGPLLVVSNHPGAYDSVAIGSCLARTDLRIIVYETGFYRAMPQIGPRLIYVSEDPSTRMLTIRTAVQHLQQGGCILQFGTGTIEPDPNVIPGAEQEIDNWFPSIEIMLRKAPQTRLVLAMASGVVQRRFAYHPFTRIRKDGIGQRRLAEFMQVIQQLIFPNSVQAEPCISFAPPVTVEQLAAESGGARLMPAIQARAKALLAEHIAAWNLPAFD